MITVMITGCSRHSADWIDALKNNSNHDDIRVIGVNVSESEIPHNKLDAWYIVPSIHSTEYIPALLSICQSEKVDVLLPFITGELLLLSKNVDIFEKNGVRLSVSSTDSLLIANDKLALYKRFPNLMPRQIITTNRHEILRFANEIGYPKRKLCCKLHNRCGGLGFAIADDESAYDITRMNKFGVDHRITLDTLITITELSPVPVIVQEFIDGTDYGFNCLADNGNMLYGIGYEATVVSYGAPVIAEIKRNKDAEAIAEYVTQELKLDGNLSFDYIVTKDGRVYMLEINPRINATIAFPAKAGLNLAYLRIKQLMGYNVKGLHFEINYGLRMKKNYVTEYYK